MPARTRSRKRQNAEIRKPEIINSFYETILEEGFEGASIAKVAGRIGIHPSLILHYFGTKENMTLALVDFVVDEYTRLLKRFKEIGGPSRKRLERLLGTIWSRDYYEKIHIAVSFSIISVGFRNEAIFNKGKELYQLFKRFLVREFTTLAESGIIRTTDPERAAEVIMTLIEGSRHFRHFFVRPDEIDRYNRDMVKTAMTVLGVETQEM